ncbi:outer membrane protein [Actibacterium lipolyticum]|uniref:Outer membrane protein beta-barrel domain-containing protein n=1 Tax=Actibacterium lipolyticum TaxID=1524263 RepID=A0A238KY33_9RHOB|nr:outer membrane beta-barrel protein [Actibacterium lipolyticum]SMX47550.1 hypothetical protein COL8621_03467 [Actibacterium lipolyticum]
MKTLIASILLFLFATTPLRAETEISLYGGVQSAPSSRVSGHDPGGVGSFNFTAKWEGESFDVPPYYGARVTWWRNDRVGYGVELNHAKVIATDASRAANGFSTLEFSDGINIVTANVFYRWPDNARRWTPYAGVGFGIAIPHVEVATAGGETKEYQLAGPAVQAVAGVSYALNDRWSVFGEYKATYSENRVELDNSGSLETNIMTNAVNLGVAVRF